MSFHALESNYMPFLISFKNKLKDMKQKRRQFDGDEKHALMSVMEK